MAALLKKLSSRAPGGNLMAHERGRSGLGRYPRRQFLRRAGAISLTGLAAPLLASPLASPAAADTPTESPIKQIIVCCQENHSFDNYFGSYSGLPAGYRIPADWENSGHKPFHFPNHTGNESNPDHEWDATHAAYDDGKMDGFYSNGNGENALGFYDESDLLYYYSLFQQYTLCANYFCGILGPTYPNRMVLYAGTSGGYTDNSAPLDGSFEWPCIISLLQDHNISFKNYNFDCDSNHSILSMWESGVRTPRAEPDERPVLYGLQAGQPGPGFIYYERPELRLGLRASSGKHRAWTVADAGHY
jgi:phospholipase C